MEQLNTFLIKIWDRIGNSLPENTESASATSTTTASSTQYYTFEDLCKMDDDKLYSIFEKMTSRERQEFAEILFFNEINLYQDMTNRFIEIITHINASNPCDNSTDMLVNYGGEQGISANGMEVGVQSEDKNIDDIFKNVAEGLAIVTNYKVGSTTPVAPDAPDALSDDQFKKWLEDQQTESLTNKLTKVWAAKEPLDSNNQPPIDTLESIVIKKDKDGHDMILLPQNILAIAQSNDNSADNIVYDTNTASSGQLPNSQLNRGLIEECPICREKLSDILKIINIGTIEEHVNSHF